MRNFTKRTEDFNNRLIRRKQGNMDNAPGFGGGMREDIADPSANALRSIEDYLCFDDRLEGRSGSKVWSDTKLPELVGRTGYSVTKSGTTVTAETEIFDESDVGNYIVYNDGKHERIIEYTSTTVVEVDRSDAHADSDAAWLHGPVNMLAKHRAQSRIIIQIDTRFFISDDMDVGAWYQVFRAGSTAPANSYSRFDEMGNYLMVFNENGIFKLDCSSVGDGTEPCIYWKANESFIDLSGITKPATNTYKYRYMMVRTRIKGTSIARDRTSQTVEQQTAPLILFDPAGQYSQVDYIEIDAAGAIDGSSYFGEVDFVFDSETQTPYTHWSIYRTLDIGDNGISPVTGSGNNSELFVWVKDKVIKRAFLGFRSGDTITSASSPFTPDDVGARIYYNTDGSYVTIATYVSAMQVTTLDSGEIAGGPMAIGSSNNAWAQQSVTGNETVGNGTITTHADSTDFTEDVVGEEVVWDDGTRSLVVRFIDANNVEVAQSEALSGNPWKYITWGTNGRLRIEDSTTDDTLRAREAGFAVKNRFMNPLPDCNDGVIAGGMLWGIIRGTGNIYYSQIPNNEEYYAGYYRQAGNGAQIDILPDDIQAIRQFSDRVLFYCSQSTWFISTNDFTTVVVKAVGEVVVVATGHWPLADIGVVDYGGIIRLDGIQKSELMNGAGDFLVCSDGGVRICNGYEFSRDLSAGTIRKSLLTHVARSAGHYDSINGVMLFRSDNTINDSTHGYVFGIEPDQQGVGWHKYLNGDPVLPFARIGGIVVLDSSNYFHGLVLDASTGLLYDVSLYDGPTGSGLSKLWVDKAASDGSGGTTITPAVEFIPERAEEEYFTLEHLESHLYTRPYNRDSGYTDGLAFTLKAYVDADTAVKAQAASVTKANDVHFDKKVRGNEIYIRVEANASNHLIVGRLNAFKSQDKAAAPTSRTTTENGYLATLGNVLLWVSPFMDRVIDRVDGSTVIASPTLTTGPDGYSDSGIQISAALSCGSVNASSKPLIIWADGTIAITVGGTPVALTSHGTVDGFTLYYGTPSSNGVVVVTPTGTRVIADLRILDEALSTAERTYYFDDVDDNDGKVVFPR